MTSNQKDVCQFSTAISLVVSGVLLVFLCYFQERVTFQDFVLGYFGMTLTFAGGVFGFALWLSGYVRRQDNKISSLQDRIDNININNSNSSNRAAVINRYDDERD